MQGSLGEKIAEGGTADIYAWAPGRVVKLFKAGAAGDFKGVVPGHIATGILALLDRLPPSIQSRSGKTSGGSRVL